METCQRIFNMEDLESYLTQSELYIAHYDFRLNSGVLKNGERFSFSSGSLASRSLLDLANFLERYEQVREIKSIKDAIIDSVQKFIREERKKIDSIIVQIIETKEEDLNVEYITKNIDDIGISIIAEKFFKNTINTYTDKVTNLFNQKFYKEFLEPNENMTQEKLSNILKGCKVVNENSSGNSKVGFVYMDLDNLKAINDKINHEAGDRAIEVFGRMLLESIRFPGIPIRIGGDEFGFICRAEDASTIEKMIESSLFVEKLNDEVAECFRSTDKAILERYPFKATCGVAFFETGKNIDARQAFKEAYLEADSKVHSKKSSRPEESIYRKLK